MLKSEKLKPFKKRRGEVKQWGVMTVKSTILYSGLAILSSYLTTERNLISGMFTLYRMDTQHSVNRQWHRTGTSRSHTLTGWPRGSWWTKSQYSLWNIYFRLSGLQPSLTALHHGVGENLHDMKRSTFEISAAHLHSVVTEIAPKSLRLHVSRSPIRYQQYGFRAGARAGILYSVSIA